MKKTFERTHSELRKRTNDLWDEKISKITYTQGIETYTVSNSNELVPPHIVTSKSSKTPFIVKAGLILFHLTIHDADSPKFMYPEFPAFFGITPEHSLYIAYGEKKNMIINGANYWRHMDPEEFGNLPDYEERMIQFLSKLGYDPNKLDSRSQKFDDNYLDVASDSTMPQVARLITYRLKKDITLYDAPGDTVDCSNFYIDGVIGGYNSGIDEKSGNPWKDNINELRLCKGPLENYLTYIDEILITSEMLSHHIYDWISVPSSMTENYLIPIRALVNTRNWLEIRTSDALMYLYIKLEGKATQEFRNLLYMNSDSYVIDEYDSQGGPDLSTIILSLFGSFGVFITMYSSTSINISKQRAKSISDLIIELTTFYKNAYNLNSIIDVYITNAINAAI